MSISSQQGTDYVVYRSFNTIRTLDCVFNKMLWMRVWFLKYILAAKWLYLDILLRIKIGIGLHNLNKATKLQSFSITIGTKLPKSQLQSHKVQMSDDFWIILKAKFGALYWKKVNIARNYNDLINIGIPNWIILLLFNY